MKLSERVTLEQLKAMSAEQIHRMWRCSQFPFDGAIECGHCVTSHQVPGSCQIAGHANFRARAEELWRKLKIGQGVGNGILANLEEFYALRLFYDHLYPPSEPVEETAAEKAFERAELSFQDSRGNTR